MENCDRERVYFTIVSRNYISYAATLMQSIEAVDPDSRRYVVLVDQSGGFDEVNIPAKMILAEDLAIPDFEDMILRYQIMELNTAVKPFAFAQMLRDFPEAIVAYIDPDILVLRRLSQVERVLNDTQELALTPHITRPLQDGKLPDDLSIMKSGIWNLGFAAMRASPDTLRLVDWWADRCRTDCRVSIPENIFTDQRWMDLAPCFVQQTAIIRDPGYNLAYWNLNHRPLSKDEGVLKADGTPITFVHFSGVVPSDSTVFSKHQSRFGVEDIGELRHLLDDYRNRLLANHWRKTSTLPYAYGQSTDGRKIHDISRRYYRQTFPKQPAKADLLKASFHGDLADWTDDAEPSLLALGPPFLSKLVYQVWRERDDLHAHFAPLTPEGRRGLLHWFAESAAREHGVDQTSIDRANRVGKFGPGVGARPKLRWPAIAETFRPVASSNILPYLAEPISFELDDGETVNCPRAFALLWELRRDLQNAFPLTTNDQWSGFLKWCYETGPLEGAFDKLLLTRTAPYFRSQFQTDTTESLHFGPLGSHVRIGYDDSFGALRTDGSVDDEDELCALVAYYVFRYAKRLDWPEEFVKPHVQVLCSQDPHIATSVPLSRLIMRIYRSRPDLRRTFNIEEEVGALGLLGWFLLHGYEEYALDDRAIDLRLRTYLFQPFGGQVTNLICSLWAANHDAVRHADLHAPNQLEAIQRWFLSVGVHQLKGKTVYHALSGKSDLAAGLTRSELAVSGYVGSASGRGEDVRMSKRALESVGIKPLVIDRAQDPRTSLGNPRARKTLVDINVCHFNAESAFLDATWHRRMGIHSKYSIGYWAWELSKFPVEWRNAFMFYDEIWASTEFARAAFASVSPRPVHLMPMVVENPQIEPSYGRAYFDLPDKSFLFFFHFDFRSFVHRKNPEAAVHAFLKAFDDAAAPVGLVVKTINAEHDPEAWEKMKALSSRDPRIKLINKEMTRVEVTSIIAACDCYVSLHRSEGFGRGLAEAMLLEKPVITTAYSGNMDFCDADTAYLVEFDLVPVREHQYIGTQGQVWADANVEHAAEIMRLVYDDQSRREGVALRGAERIREKYSAEVVGAAYQSRLRAIHQQLNKASAPSIAPPSGGKRKLVPGWDQLLRTFTNRNGE